MKMAKNINSRTHGRSDTAATKWSALDPNDLKSVVRDGLVSMNMAEREEFIGTLEAEMKRAGLNMRAYLVPLGIPGRSSEDLTPTEVAHLIRFLKLNVTRALQAIDRALAQYAAFDMNGGSSGHKIAA